MAEMIGTQTHVDSFDVDLDEVKLEALHYERPEHSQHGTMGAIALLAVCERLNALVVLGEAVLVKLQELIDEPPNPPGGP